MMKTIYKIQLSVIFFIISCQLKQTKIDFTINRQQIKSVEDIAGKPKSVDVVKVKLGESVVFQQKLLEKPIEDLEFKWNFGDGKEMVSKEKWVIHQFQKEGIYEVELCLSGEGCVNKYVEAISLESTVINESLFLDNEIISTPTNLSEESEPAVSTISENQKISTNKPSLLLNKPLENTVLEEIFNNKDNRADNDPFDRSSNELFHKTNKKKQ